MALANAKRQTRALLMLITAIIVLVAAAAGTLAFVFRGRAFDKAVWSDRKQEAARLAMADRIVARRLLDGKSRAEVTAMLGDHKEPGFFTDWDLVYWLGTERGFVGIDSEWLVVRFDANGRVAEYQIVRD